MRYLALLILLPNALLATAPVISALSFTANSPNSVKVTFTTDISSSTQLLCDPANGGPYVTYVTPVVDPTAGGWGVTAHAVTVNVPTASTQHCIAKAAASNGDTATTADNAVTTPAAYAAKAIRIVSVGARKSITAAACPSGKGYSADLLPMTWGASSVYRAGYDSSGICTAPGTYVYTTGAGIALGKWTDASTPSSMMSGTDTTNVFGNAAQANAPNWTPNSGSSSSNICTLGWAAAPNHFAMPVGSNVYVTGVTPSGYNVSNVTTTAASTTSVTYPCTAGSAAWSSGGNMKLWNDGGGFDTVGILSYLGTLSIWPFRTAGGSAQYMMSSVDEFAHSWNNAHNGPTPTTVPALDIPLPSTQSVFGGGSTLRVALFPLQPCQDYQFNCTWQAGTDGYIYFINARGPGTSGYYLWRIRTAQWKEQDWSEMQFYTGGQADDDRGLYDSSWAASSTCCTGVTLLSSAAWANTIQGTGGDIMWAPAPFNRFLISNWAGSGSGGSQSLGTTIWDLGIWPWGNPVQAGSVGGDANNVNVFETWGRFLPSTYTVVSAAPPAATVTFEQSGSYRFSTLNPATNQYGPNQNLVYLSERTATSATINSVAYRQVQTTYNGSANTFPGKGLELYYDFAGCVGGSLRIPNLAPMPSGNYDTVLTGTPYLPLMCDQIGLRSFGLPDGQYGASGTNPLVFKLPTGFNLAMTDFSIFIPFRHLDGDNSGRPSGECAVSAAQLSICRNGTAQNSWIVTVGATSSGALSIITDTGWEGVLLVRSGSTTKVYKSSGIGSTQPYTVLATITDATSTGTNTLYLGATSSGTHPFQGWINRIMIWSRALSADEIGNVVGLVRKQLLALTVPMA